MERVEKPRQHGGISAGVFICVEITTSQALPLYFDPGSVFVPEFKI